MSRSYFTLKSTVKKKYFAMNKMNPILGSVTCFLNVSKHISSVPVCFLLLVFLIIFNYDSHYRNTIIIMKRMHFTVIMSQCKKTE